MLQQLSIKNIALIESLVLELGSGFNVLSGETGAGKSIIIDSLNLVLGERADKELVRTGTQKARVEGVFSYSDNEIDSLLEENGVDKEEGTLIISREISSDGKSLCRINGCSVTLNFLKKIADRLCDIHGQHEHQLLLSPETHLSFLDSYGGEKIARQRECVRLAFTYYKSCIEKLNGDWGTPDEREEKMQALNAQIEEIENAEITVGQEDELKERSRILSNSGKIKECLEENARLLGGTALDDLRSASSSLQKISDVNESYSVLCERLNSAFYEVEDIVSELNSELANVDNDPYELERIEDRLALLKKLYRKYGSSEEEILKYYDDACEELDRLRNAEHTIAELEKQKEQFENEYIKQARILSELRHDTAIDFEDRIKLELAELGMKNANLEVDFKETDGYSANGTDDVEFLFSANIGEPVRPLSKIISGGEMSRFMLAMKSIAADDAMLPTMVFDEIDTGISGQGALVVAQKIARLSRRHQVIAITHLPQLASMADDHFLIKKLADENSTHTEVTPMDYDARLDEIARLAGGSGTSLARQRADEILREAVKFKKSL